jgi:hypothetical protein
VTVIVVSFFESVFADHSKDHPVAVAYFSDTLTRSRTPPCRTSLSKNGTNGSKERRIIEQHIDPAKLLR